MSGPGAAEGKGAAESVGGIPGKAPAPDLLASAPRLPAVSKPKGDAKRKAAPKSGAVKPAGKAKGVAKVLRVGWLEAHNCYLLLWVRLLCYVLTFPRQELVKRYQHLHMSPIAMGLPPGLALPALHGGIHPVGFPPLPRDGLVPPLEAGAVPPPLAPVCSAVDSQQPSATSVIRFTRRGPGNATGWFAEVQFVGCSGPLFGQLLAQLLSPTGTGVLHVCSSSISSLCCTRVS